MLELVFLGTGSGVPTPKRNLSSLYCRYEGDSWLWDCGEGTQRQLFKAGLNFMGIDRIFITHWHADHWAGIIGLMQTMNLEKRTAPLHVYAPEAERFLGDILDLDYWGPRFKIIPTDVPYRGKEITALHTTKEYEILSIPVKHGIPAVSYAFKEADRINVDIKKAETIYGLKQGPLVGQLKDKGSVEYKGRRIKLMDVALVKRGVKVVYSGDTKICETMAAISTGADVLIHETTFASAAEMEGTQHSTPEAAARLAKEAGVKTLVLTHFSRRYLDVSDLVAKAKKILPSSIAASDFLRLRIRDDGTETDNIRDRKPA